MLDIINKVSFANALAALTANKNALNGPQIDLLSVNNGSNTLAFAIVAGTITDGTHTFTLQDSPDGVTWTNVAAPYLQIGASGNVFTSATTAGTVLKLGYLGNPGGASRYVRVVVAASGSTGGIYYGVALLGGGEQLPAA